MLVGMEPTGHYFKPLAHYLLRHGIKVVLINPYYTKRVKELDDNSPTKNDKKDTLTIARLTRDGRYYELYLPLESIIQYQSKPHEAPECLKEYHQGGLR